MATLVLVPLVYFENLLQKITVKISSKIEKLTQNADNTTKTQEDEEKDADKIPKNEIQTESPSTATEPQLDITSEEFDPLRALYAADYKVSDKKPKVLYQNIAAFESAFKKFGILKLNSRNMVEASKTVAAGATSSAVESKCAPITYIADLEMQRRFLPHQMAVHCPREQKQRHKRNLLQHIAVMEGPQARLRLCIEQGERVRVSVRNKRGIRGTLEGLLLFYDKHWNLLLRDVHETWKRRKYDYGENNFSGVAQNCSQQLQELGIVLPEQQVRSLNRKNVEITRHVSQLLVRGEQVVLVTVLAAADK